MDEKKEKSPLETRALLKSILSKGRLKVKNARKREAAIRKTNSLQKKIDKPVKDKIEKRLASKLKPKTRRFERVESDKVKQNKQLATKVKRNPQGFKVREPKHNHIDKDMIKQKAMERIFENFARKERERFKRELF